VLRDGLADDADDPRLARSLSWLLSTSWQGDSRDGAGALEWARGYCGAAGEEDVDCLDTLAAAYAESGEFEQAVDAARRAAVLADSTGDDRLAAAIRRRLDMYRHGRPYHQLP